MQLQNSSKIALDTNMLLAIKQLKVDVFFELETMFGKKTEFLIPKQVFKEIQEMKKRGKTLEKAAEIALEEIERHQVSIVEIEAKNADNALENMAKQGCFVASNDAALRKRIKGFGERVIYLRQGHFLKTD